MAEDPLTVRIIRKPRDPARHRRKLAAARERKARGAQRAPRWLVTPDAQTYVARVHEIGDVPHLTVTGPEPLGRLFGLKATLNLVTGRYVWVEDANWRGPELWRLLDLGQDLGRIVLEEEGFQRSGLGLIGQARLFPVEESATVAARRDEEAL